MIIRGITLFDPDIHKIPEFNFQKFQRCLLLSAGVGSTIQELMSHADKINIYHTEKREADFTNQLLNLKLSLFSTLEGLSYNSMAFACMVAEFEGKTPEIKTDADIKTLSNQIIATGITHEEVQDYVDILKKKLMRN